MVYRAYTISPTTSFQNELISAFQELFRIIIAKISRNYKISYVINYPPVLILIFIYLCNFSVKPHAKKNVRSFPMVSTLVNEMRWKLISGVRSAI